MLVTYLRKAFHKLGEPQETIRAYRGGYLPKQRRQIERDLRDGKVLGVVSTNALELGIDIGTLQAAVLTGYPGTIASTWQQLGRAGRSHEPSLAVLVATSSPPQPVHDSKPRLLHGTGVWNMRGSIPITCSFWSPISNALPLNFPSGKERSSASWIPRRFWIT